MPIGLTLLVAGALFVSGCSDDKKEEASKPTVNSSLPRVYETPDGKVDLGDGETVTLETPEGTHLLMNERLPDDFPKDFPILEGAKIQTSSVQPKKDSVLQTTRYFIALGAAEAFEKYLGALPAVGYKLGEQKRVDDGPAGFDASVMFQGEGDKSKESGQVVVSINKEQVQVSITLTTVK